jgi:hypothetical protein
VAETKKIFTFDEARDLIPAVRERTRAALEALSGVEVAPDESAEAVRARMEQAAGEILGSWARDIQAMGIEVKALARRLRLRRGYWCWRWPEESLDYFHDYETGFAGRVRSSRPRLRKAQSPFPFVRHHLGAPGVPDDGDLGLGDAGQRRDLLLRVGGDRRAHAASRAVSVIFTSTRLFPREGRIRDRRRAEVDDVHGISGS